MALKNKIELYGGNSWRPFISVNDVSRAIIKILNTEKELIKNQIFNLGGDTENYKIIDIIKEIKKNTEIEYKAVKKIDDKRNYRVSFKKIYKILSFKPKDNLKEIYFKINKKYKN